MSRSLLALNLVLAAATALFFVQLVRGLLVSRPLPAPLIPRPVQAVVSPTDDPARARAPLTAYSVVATRNLFNPNRSEMVSQTTSPARSEEHTSELQSLAYLVCRLLLEKKNRTGHAVSRA